MPANKKNSISPVLPVYNRAKLQFSHGKGVYLYSTDGKKYLDFAAGIAVNSLGHAHPHVVKALTEQAKKLWHLSNLYEIPGLYKLAERLVENTFADTVFFCNSGAEAVECGIKMVRKYFSEKGHPEKHRIITFKGSFHGRTLATISAGDPEKNIKGFEPALPGFDNVEWEDLNAVKKAITVNTAAILVEPIQGEGGIRVAKKEFIKGLKDLCKKHDLLLFFDEIQCGYGRTGTFFAHELYDVTPDIMSVAKGIGSGFPMGACLATERAASGMKPGSHGSTYGNNPLAMAVGNAVLDIILAKNFIKNVEKTGAYLKKKLSDLSKKFPKIIIEVRGAGLIIGLKTGIENKIMVEKLRELKLLTVPASDNVVRILPPLIINKKEVDEGVAIIERACRELKGK